MQSENADVWFASTGTHRLVHGLYNVAPDAELAQGLVEARLQRPAGGPDWMGKAEPFELRGAAEQQVAQLRSSAL